MAVNNLRPWFARGEDAGALLPVLQACMGHAGRGEALGRGARGRLAGPRRASQLLVLICPA
jgi:hypothetical protein